MRLRKDSCGTAGRKPCASENQGFRALRGQTKFNRLEDLSIRYDANHEPDQMQMRCVQPVRLKYAALASKRCGQTYSLTQLRESRCAKA